MVDHRHKVPHIRYPLHQPRRLGLRDGQNVPRQADGAGKEAH